MVHRAGASPESGLPARRQKKCRLNFGGSTGDGFIFTAKN
jgi:hypothetical protein